MSKLHMNNEQALGIVRIAYAKLLEYFRVWSPIARSESIGTNNFDNINL